METIIRYKTTVQKNGIIKIPKMATLAHQRVEVIIRPLQSEEKSSSEAAKAFVEKWRGLLKNTDPDELKAQYPQEK